MNTLIIKHLAILGMIFFTTSLVAVAETTNPRELYRRWEALKSPWKASPEALGSYSAGCLLGAKVLPERGVGYQIMRPQRQRHYGHPELIELIEKLARTQYKASKNKLLIGDISRPRGGPTISGHVSHQTGLDVDIWYMQTPKTLSRHKREQMSSPDIVRGDTVKNWRKIYTDTIRNLALNPKVERIFVNPAIKKLLCKNEPEGKEWLAKLRPWWGHSDHFHVRMYCPSTDSRCVAQESIDLQNSGCDEKELAWWFSQEAKEELAKRQSAITAADRPFPDLPQECSQLLVTSRAK